MKRKKLKTAAISVRMVDVHDLVRADVPRGPDIEITEMRNPYVVSEDAVWDSARGEWTVPRRPPIRVIQSFKCDPIGKMFARKQIDEREHDAARRLQRLHDDAQIGVIRAVDPGREAVDGGSLPEVLTDRQQRAIRKIRLVERAICEKHGKQGLSVLNGVLIEKRTVDQFAAIYGYHPPSPKKIDYWRALFRECLHTLGAELGTISVAA